jgi:hypothetical protein
MIPNHLDQKICSIIYVLSPISKSMILGEYNLTGSSVDNKEFRRVILFILA